MTLEVIYKWPVSAGCAAPSPPNLVLILRSLMSAFSSLFPCLVWSETWHRRNRTLEREGKGEGRECGFQIGHTPHWLPTP